MKKLALCIFITFGSLAVFTSAQTSSTKSLKDVFKSDFMIGAALNRRQFTEEDTRALPIISTHFNTITSENQLKWQYIHPRLNTYDFKDADRYVAFGEKYGMYVIGHTLVWHNQTPSWVFQDGKGNRVSRDVLLARMRDHIQTVVGRYKGRIKGWDVVNEAINADGSMRASEWMKIIGEDYVAKAFEFAHEADPNAELYYNDFSLESAPKRNGAVRLIQQLQSKGIRVTGVGLQGHNRIGWPSMQEQDDTITAFAKLGMRINITELDVDVLPRVDEDEGRKIILNDELQPKLNPYRNALPDTVGDTQAKTYADLFTVYLKHRDVIDRITFWGVTDSESWLNNFPVRGRTNYPLLFDRQGKPKPAYDAVISVATSPRKQN